MPMSCKVVFMYVCVYIYFLSACVCVCGTEACLSSNWRNISLDRQVII